MTAPRPLAVRDARGFQHSNDQYYYRPLVAGDAIFTYVAHVPAGGDMPPSEEEAKLFELSLFMLDGELDCSLSGDQVTVRAGEGLHIPLNAPFGVNNRTDRSATFVLSFSPPPRVGGIQQMFTDAEERGRRIFEPAEFADIIGESSFPLR